MLSVCKRQELCWRFNGRHIAGLKFWVWNNFNGVYISLNFRCDVTGKPRQLMCMMSVFKNVGLKYVMKTNFLFQVRWSRYVYPWLTFTNSTFCPHSSFMCFAWIWEQAAIIWLYIIYWLVFITEIRCAWLNPLNSELNPICHLLALLAHHIFHVSGLRVKASTAK